MCAQAPAVPIVSAASNNSDEVRHPWPKRKSVRVTARRLVRGPPGAPKSVDYRPGEMAKSSPDAPFPEGEPFGEPGEVCQDVALLQSDLSPRARKKKWAEASVSPPPSVSPRLAGGPERMPKIPLCVMSIPQDTMRYLFGDLDASSWWDESL